MRKYMGTTDRLCGTCRFWLCHDKSGLGSSGMCPHYQRTEYDEDCYLWEDRNNTLGHLQGQITGLAARVQVLEDGPQVDWGGLSVAQAAGQLGIHPSAVRQACASGRLVAGKHGSNWVITQEAVDTYEPRRNINRRTPPKE